VIFHDKEKGLTLAIVKDKREFLILRENVGSPYLTNSWRLSWICYKNVCLHVANELFQKEYKKIIRIGKSDVLVHTQVKIEGKWAKTCC